jgi:hypothetical protein
MLGRALRARPFLVLDKQFSTCCLHFPHHLPFCAAIFFPYKNFFTFSFLSVEALSVTPTDITSFVSRKKGLASHFHCKWFFADITSFVSSGIFQNFFSNNIKKISSSLNVSYGSHSLRLKRS